MVITTTNDLKAYLKKHGLTYDALSIILQLSHPTICTKVNNLTFTIKELQAISESTKDMIIIEGE